MIAQLLGVSLQSTDYCSLICPRLSSINKHVTRSLLILILRSLHGSNTFLAAFTATPNQTGTGYNRHDSSSQLHKHAEIMSLFIVRLSNLGRAVGFMWTLPLCRAFLLIVFFTN